MEVVDFGRLADLLPDSHKITRQLIRDAVAVHSAQTDLKMAHDLAARLLDLDTDSGSLPTTFVEDCGLALLCTSIIFYVRATKSQSDHRKTFDIRSQFDETEKKDHDLLASLRDDAIAHFGPGDLGSARVREDWLLFSLEHGKPLGVSRNIVGSRSLARTIRHQCQRALMLMQQLSERKQAQLAECINALSKDPIFVAAWDAAETRLVDAVGEQMAAQIEEGPTVGTSRLHQRPR